MPRCWKTASGWRCTNKATPNSRLCRKHLEMDRRYNASLKGRERKRRYEISPKGRETFRRYNNSRKGRARNRRYFARRIAVNIAKLPTLLRK